MHIGFLSLKNREIIHCPQSYSQEQHFLEELYNKAINVIDIYDFYKNPELLANLDYVVFNTCIFDGKYLESAIYAINSLIYYQQKYNYEIILVGCFSKLKIVDKILNMFYAETPDCNIKFIDDLIWSDVVLNYILGENKLINEYDQIITNSHNYYCSNDISISINIVSGCANNCSFCKYNYMNNSLKSLPYHELLAYLKRKIRNGTKVIDLHGLSLPLYGIDLIGKPMLHTLLYELSKEENLMYIILGEITPQNIYPELMDEMINNKKIKSVALQLESASNQILEKMNRHYTIEKYDEYALNLINSGKFVDTVLMSGFPEETIEDLNRSIDYIKTRKIDIFAICEYIDCNLLPSHKLKQLSPEEKKNHTLYLNKALEEVLNEIRNDRAKLLGNGIVIDKYDDVVIIDAGVHYRCLSYKHKDKNVGDIITDSPKSYIQKRKMYKY